MNGLIYIVGLIVVIGVILSFFGLRWAFEKRSCGFQSWIPRAL